MRLHSANLIIGLLIGFATLSAIAATCPHAVVEKVKRGVQDRLKRQAGADPAGGDTDPADANNDAITEKRVPIGDVVNGGKTPVGKSIYNQLMGSESSQSKVILPDVIGPITCLLKKNPCCIWYQVSTALTLMFKDLLYGCNDNARAAIRLGFHDAGTWNTSLTYGGADGSFLINEEWTRPENLGLQDIAQKMISISKKYGVGKADLIQYAAKHAVVTCSLGPRIRTYVGRIDCQKGVQAADGLLPSVFADANSLIALFKAKTIYPHMLAALVGAHSTSKQFHVDPTCAGAPQDSTPTVWDVKFYKETLLTPPPKGVFKFQSDVVLSTHPQIASEWNAFINDQEHWNEDYANAYVRLSLLGVYNINQLTECTTTLPLRYG